MAAYPSEGADRDVFVLERRNPRPSHDPWRYHDVIVEEERTEDGMNALVATVLLTGRECPWRCVMCDLWKGAIAEDTPRGAIAAQIRNARRHLDEAGRMVGRMKLYNAGSFFDPRAVPEADYAEIAASVAGLERLIVESHPALVGSRVDRFLQELDRHSLAGGAPRLEVAMGLETAHPLALERLHKKMPVELFAGAAAGLARRHVGLRVFLLIQPPFIDDREQELWLLRSVDEALSCGATAISLVPTRSGNGAMEALAAEGLFREPSLHDVERLSTRALARAAGRARVLVDLWDFDRLVRCPWCRDRRRARLALQNRRQRPVAPIRCDHCGCWSGS
jgi:radical SAM enzyme (TIGR01210 family)